MRSFAAGDDCWVGGSWEGEPGRTKEGLLTRPPSTTNTFLVTNSFKSSPVYWIGVVGWDMGATVVGETGAIRGDMVANGLTLGEMVVATVATAGDIGAGVTTSGAIFFEGWPYSK